MNKVEVLWPYVGPKMIVLGFFRTMGASFMANHRTAPLHRMFTPFYCS